MDGIGRAAKISYQSAAFHTAHAQIPYWKMRSWGGGDFVRQAVSTLMRNNCRFCGYPQN